MGSGRLPMVRGGDLCEAEGGPWDGEVLFLPHAEPCVYVYRFPGDPQSLTTSQFGPQFGEHYVGSYSTRGAIPAMTQRLYWCGATAGC